jgi:beta-galactosidase
MKKDKMPFLFGAQYYRAPTPERECWAQDLARMKQLGFNQVKYWVQWRWQHRAPDKFYWDDLDQLMNLAAGNGIGVTLNTIFDVSPIWLFDRYPDAKQVGIQGDIVEPFAIQHRQIGGQPGPCYNHPGALAERKKFLRAAAEHFRGHPAMHMWDVWNEPEQSYPRREPKLDRLTCYCANCASGFRTWLRRKYETMDRINDVWGRCYSTWDEVELPRQAACVTDMVDWREFHLDTMTNEAKWRLETVRHYDPDSVAYLHVVPNTMQPFNSVTCVDDFELAEQCDVWAATMNQSPTFTTQVISAARGKVAYNVESHVNFGSLRMHQRMLGLNDLLGDWLPQIGLGVKGFLLWQFRPEVIGTESPAWGLVKPDGSDRPVTQAARTFWEKLSPHAPALMDATPAPAQIGIYKGRRNELFHWCMDQNLDSLAGGVDAYLQNLYWMNHRLRFVSGQMLERGQLDRLKLLILPQAMYLTQAEVDQLDEWVRAGGTALCEAHFASYDATRGRHTRTTPGMGIAERWGIRETDSTSTHHLKVEHAGAISANLADDERKALRTSGAIGGEYVPVRLTSGTTAWGGSRYAILEASGAETLGSFDGANPTILYKKVGKGAVVYAGTNLGQGSKRDAAGLREVIDLVAKRAGVERTLGATNAAADVHVDVLQAAGRPAFAVVRNRADAPRELTVSTPLNLRGLFSGQSWKLSAGAPFSVPAGFVDLMQVDG